MGIVGISQIDALTFVSNRFPRRRSMPTTLPSRIRYATPSASAPSSACRRFQRAGREHLDDLAHVPVRRRLR
jgi:hypothetical protein